MKTKAEALANPAVGDRWKLKRSRARRTISKFEESGYSDWAIIYWNDNANSTYWHVFKRWAAGAEYLGNEGDNA